MVLNQPKVILYIHPKWKQHCFNRIYYTRDKTPLPPRLGNEIKLCVGILNLISWGVSLLKKNLKKKAKDLSDLGSW